MEVGDKIGFMFQSRVLATALLLCISSREQGMLYTSDGEPFRAFSDDSPLGHSCHRFPTTALHVSSCTIEPELGFTFCIMFWRTYPLDLLK